MLDFPRWKVWSITLTILVGIFFAIPSLLPQAAKDKWPSWLPKETISLGLDLAGGSQLLLEADAADAQKQRLQAMEDTVTTELRRAPRVEIGDISTAGGRLSFMVRDPRQLDTAVERLRALTDPISFAEAEEIYLPLSRLISLYVEATQELHRASTRFLGAEAVVVGERQAARA